MSTPRLVVLFLLAAAIGAHAENTLSFKMLRGGSVSAAVKPSHKVFRTSQQFANYWAATFGNTQVPKGIDWAKSELVAIHLGHRGSFGYEVRVVSVERVGQDTVVTWSERLPLATDMSHARESSPYVIASFPAQPGKVLFHTIVQDPRKPYASGDAFLRRTFLSGAHCLLATETATVISDSQALAAFWVTAFGKATPAPACDFTKWRLVAVFLGQRPTPGYTPLIDRIARIGPREVQIMYSETKPTPGTILPQVVTNPFVILQIPVTADVVTVDRSIGR